MIINGANNKSQLVGWLSLIKICVNWKVGLNLSFLLFSCNMHFAQ